MPTNLFNSFCLRLKQSSSRFFEDAKRTGWALALAGFGLLFILKSGRDIFVQQSGVLLWKLLLVGTAVFVGHKVRQQLFPYIDLSAHLEEKSVAGAIVFLGTAILYSVIILALCAGL